MQWQEKPKFLFSFFFVMHNFRSANTMFAVEWLGHKVALKANNGKYICTKKNGQLLAVSDSTGKRHFLVFSSLLLLLPPPSSLLYSLFHFLLSPSVRWGRTAHFETDQPAHVDPERRERIHLPPQELQHAGRQQISLWHFQPSVQ